MCNFTTHLFSFIELKCKRSDNDFNTDISEEIFRAYNDDVSLDFEDTCQHKGVVTLLAKEIIFKADKYGVVRSMLTSKLTRS